MSIRVSDEHLGRLMPRAAEAKELLHNLARLDAEGDVVRVRCVISTASGSCSNDQHATKIAQWPLHQCLVHAGQHLRLEAAALGALRQGQKDVHLIVKCPERGADPLDELGLVIEPLW